MKSTTFTASMKVQEYRDCISWVRDCWASVRSAATDKEWETEAQRAERAVNQLVEAHCPRATAEDKARAQRMIDMVCEYISTARIYRAEAAAAAV